MLLLDFTIKQFTGMLCLFLFSTKEIYYQSLSKPNMGCSVVLAGQIFSQDPLQVDIKLLSSGLI